MRRPLALLALVAVLGCKEGARSPDTWNEQSLCRDPKAWVHVRIVEQDQAAVPDVWVWTEARLRDGFQIGAESEGRDIVRRGPASRTDERGDVIVCDVTQALTNAYGVTGSTSSGFGGRTWTSLLAVNLFVEAGPSYVRVPRFASRRWGDGQVLPLPASVVVPPGSVGCESEADGWTTERSVGCGPTFA